MNGEGPAKRRSWIFWGAIALLCGLVPLGYFLFLGRSQPLPPPPPPPKAVAPKPPEAITLTLSEAQGKVEVRRGGHDWQPASVGEALHSADAVRTRDGAKATLEGGKAYVVHLESGTEISVNKLTDSISKLMLGSGMARAVVDPSARHLFEVSAAGSDAVASTRGGAFGISNDGQGTVAVGTRSGEVRFQGHGKVVIVKAGERSVARTGTGPSAPAPIPSTLLLDVRWPGKKLLTRRSVVVRGKAEPGALVDVGGHLAHVDARGHFHARVRLAEGKNSVSVRARAVGQSAVVDHHTLEVDTHAPKVRVDRSLWK